jgi:hypothetical protein
VTIIPSPHLEHLDDFVVVKVNSRVRSLDSRIDLPTQLRKGTVLAMLTTYDRPQEIIPILIISILTGPAPLEARHFFGFRTQLLTLTSSGNISIRQKTYPLRKSEDLFETWRSKSVKAKEADGLHAWGSCNYPRFSSKLDLSTLHLHGH